VGTAHLNPKVGNAHPTRRDQSQTRVTKNPGEQAIERSQRINEQIRISPVRVISAEGEQLGVMPIEQALAAAREAELDLVEVAADVRPPVCRIMDFGKFKYQQQKRKHKAHQIKIKEIRVRPKTDEHDLGVKLNHAREFLVHKNKVLVSVVFRGREIAHIQDEGQRIVQFIIKNLEDIARVETPPNTQGKRIT
jgi:translation initiation factor IF-3